MLLMHWKPLPHCPLKHGPAATPPVGHVPVEKWLICVSKSLRRFTIQSVTDIGVGIAHSEVIVAWANAVRAEAERNGVLVRRGNVFIMRMVI